MVITSPWYTTRVGPGFVSVPGLVDQPAAVAYRYRVTAPARAGVEKANGTRATHVRHRTSPNTAGPERLRLVIVPSRDERGPCPPYPSGCAYRRLVRVVSFWLQR